MSQEEIKMVLEIINSIAIIAASGVAIYGINAWKKEFSGKRRIELAEEVLALFYEAKDAIRAIRNPIVLQEEGKTREAEGNETSRRKAARDSVYFVYERYDKRQEVFNRLYSKRYQFMARFGCNVAKPFEDLRAILTEIQVSTDRLAGIRSAISDTPSQETGKQIEKHESIIQSIGENDLIASRVEKVVSDIEAICRPIITGKLCEGKHPENI